MKRIAGKQLEQLSEDDWTKIHQSLLRRYKHFDDGNVRNISFGLKRCRRKRQHDGCIVVRFHVREKLDEDDPRLADRPQLPKTVCVRLRQKDGSYCEVFYATDVQQQPAPAITATSEYVRYQADVVGSTGIPVSIPKSQPSTGKHWGLLTVTHPFRSVSGYVDVSVDGRGSQADDIPGLVGARSRLPRSKFDVAMIEAKKADMERGGVFENDGVLPMMMTESQLIQAAADKEVGSIRRPERGPAIVTVTDYFPEKDFEDDVFGNMRAVIEGEAQQQGVFFVGTSGSTWRLRNRLAGMQFGATPDLRTGYAQAAFAIAKEWLEVQYDATPTVHRSF